MSAYWKWALGLALVAGVLFLLQTPAKPVMPINANLKRMSESARTPRQHVNVAKQSRERAGELAAQARKHEADAARLESAPRSALEHKWPAMGRQPWIRERELAEGARRAAREHIELADHHIRLSVEALASGQQKPGNSEGR